MRAAASKNAKSPKNVARMQSFSIGEGSEKRISCLRDICCKPILCYETGQVFSSMSEAAEYLQKSGKSKQKNSDGSFNYKIL